MYIDTYWYMLVHIGICIYLRLDLGIIRYLGYTGINCVNKRKCRFKHMCIQMKTYKNIQSLYQ